jgi:hypothetical protein
VKSLPLRFDSILPSPDFFFLSDLVLLIDGTGKMLRAFGR